jgi:hypothetical protein
MVTSVYVVLTMETLSSRASMADATCGRQNLVLVVLQLDTLAHERPRHRGPIGRKPKTLMRRIGDLKGLRRPLPKMPLLRPC